MKGLHDSGYRIVVIVEKSWKFELPLVVAFRSTLLALAVVLALTNGSWEQFYRNFQAALHPQGVPVQTYLFRLSGTPAPATLGEGFYIDELCMSVAKSGLGDDSHHRDRDRDDDDEDGKPDDNDDDDDNDGLSDLADADDDNDGIEDAFDGRLTYEDQNSFAVDLGAGGTAEYPVAASADTVSLTGVIADGLTMDVVTPAGAAVAASVPVDGRTVLTVPTTLPGEYVLRVRNTGLGSVTSQLTVVRSTRGAILSANPPS